MAICVWPTGVEYPPLEQKAPNHWAACWESDRVVPNSAKDL